MLWIIPFVIAAQAPCEGPCPPENELDIFTKIVPPTPDAGKLASYAEIPVSYFTGTPNIEIPIHELKGKELTLPVKLSYKAGGIKVEEVSSAVGLGWSLVAGGVISRTVYGLPDEGTAGVPPNSFFDNYTQLQANKLGLPWDCNAPNTISGFRDFQQAVLKFKNKDVQPDIYMYNFNGHTGKIFLDQYGSSQTLPYKKYIITPGNGPQSTGNTWTIKTDNGDTYVFSAFERTRTDVQSGDEHDVDKDYISSWYLTSITSRNSIDQINFEYQSTSPAEIEVKSNFGLSESRLDPSPGSDIHCNPPNPYSYSASPLMFVKQLFLSRITTNHGQEVELTLASDRQDYIGALRYSSIIVKEFGTTIKTVNLINNQYFGSGSETSKRLKLERLEITGLSGSTPEIYRFEYNPTGLSDRLSRAQDFWGYANSSGMGPTSMIPALDGLSGADRSAEATYTKACNLEQVHYPTGGYSEYIYELNSVGTQSVGGLRLKELKLYGVNSQLLKRTSYTYEGTEINSMVFSTPGVVDYIDCGGPPQSDCLMITRFAANRNQVGGAAAYHVGYHLVTEEVRDLQDQSGNGKTVYNFRAHPITTPYPFTPAFNSATDLGLLLSKKVYDASGSSTPLKSEEYSYQSISSPNENLIPQTGYTAETVSTLTGLMLANELNSTNLSRAWKTNGCSISYVNDECIPSAGGYTLFDNWNPTRAHAYTLTSTWSKYPIGKVTRDRSGASELVTVEIYKYQNVTPTLYPVITQKTVSTSLSNEILVEDRLYPFSAGYSGVPYSTMLTRNMHTQVVEKRQSKLISGTPDVSTPVFAEKYGFSLMGVKILPTTYSIAGDGANYRNEITNIQYDDNGNVVSLSRKEQPSAYLWDGLYLVAELKGGLNFQYEGFEDATSGFSLTAKAGRKSHDGAYTVVPHLPGTYKLTYYIKDGAADWTFEENIISSSTEIGGTNKLVDEVRLFPVGTLMTTYTHDKGIGITSSSDPNSRITYYEYDNKGRLWLVRDHDKNIVKQVKYHVVTEDN